MVTPEVQALREARRRAIRLNPVTITITRREKVRQGGGFREEVTTLRPQVVRVYRKGRQAPRPVESIPGTLQLQPWGLLADHTADLKADADEFEVPGLGRFRIVQVWPDLRNGEVTGYQADLERVV